MSGSTEVVHVQMIVDQGGGSSSSTLRVTKFSSADAFSETPDTSSADANTPVTRAFKTKTTLPAFKQWIQDLLKAHPEFSEFMDPRDGTMRDISAVPSEKYKDLAGFLVTLYAKAERELRKMAADAGVPLDSLEGVRFDRCVRQTGKIRALLLKTSKQEDHRFWCQCVQDACKALWTEDPVDYALLTGQDEADLETKSFFSNPVDQCARGLPITKDNIVCVGCGTSSTQAGSTTSAQSLPFGTKPPAQQLKVGPLPHSYFLKRATGLLESIGCAEAVRFVYFHGSLGYVVGDMIKHGVPSQKWVADFMAGRPVGLDELCRLSGTYAKSLKDENFAANYLHGMLVACAKVFSPMVKQVCIQPKTLRHAVRTDPNPDIPLPSVSWIEQLVKDSAAAESATEKAANAGDCAVVEL